MKYLKFIDGGDIIYIEAFMIYRFDQFDNNAISISTRSPDNSVFEIFYHEDAQSLIDRINADDEYDVINCIRPSDEIGSDHIEHEDLTS